jgi:hypothetical protein
MPNEWSVDLSKSLRWSWNHQLLASLYHINIGNGVECCYCFHFCAILLCYRSQCLCPVHHTVNSKLSKIHISSYLWQQVVTEICIQLNRFSWPNQMFAEPVQTSREHVPQEIWTLTKTSSILLKGQATES